MNAHSSEQAENRILNQDKETEKEKQEETQTISEQEKLSILIPAIPNIWITTSFTLPTVRSLWNRSPLKNSFA